MKSKTILLALVLSILVLTGCNPAKVTPSPSPQANTSPNPSPVATPAATPGTSPATSPAASPDVVTTASIVNTEAAFENAMKNTGTWIIAALKDMTFDKELVLDGEFKNGKKDDAGKDIIQRKIALYAQDENRKVTARYLLTAPKLTVNSLNARIQSGTFKGDLYISAKNFQLVDATVDGNVYFITNDAKNTFKMDATSKITGKQEMKK